jgi:hypothetical protein
VQAQNGNLAHMTGERAQTKLKANLAIDAVDCSQLMRKAKSGTQERLQVFKKISICPKVAGNGAPH